MTNMAKIHYLRFTEGLYSDVAPHLVPSGADNSGVGGGLSLMSNVVTSYRLGSLLKRPGYSIIGSALQANKAITGLHNFRQSASVQKMLATVNDSTDDDTQLFYSTGGAWSEVTAAETAWANKANILVEMEDFLGYCFMVGYGSTDGFIDTATLTGTTFSTSTNLTNAPDGKFIKRYRDRLYIANVSYGGNDYPYRVRFSAIPSAGAIGDWDFTDNFFDVDYSESITGIGVNWDRLMVFTAFSAYMYNQDFKKRVWDVGCSSHRTIRNSGKYMIWANYDGVFVSVNGGDPANVAGRVIDYVRYGDMRNSFAEVVDEEYHLYIGAVTVAGISYVNATLVLHIPSMTWRVHEYADGFGVFAQYYTGGQNKLWLGASDGEVHQLGKYTDASLANTDNGSAINSHFQTGAMDMGDPSMSKKINKIITYSDRAQGLNLRARIVDRNTQGTSDFKPLGEITRYIDEFQVRPDTGNFLQIEGTEYGSNPYWSLFGFTLDVEPDRVTDN